MSEVHKSLRGPRHCEPSHPLGERMQSNLASRILRTCAFVGSLIAGVLAGEKLAKAQEAGDFGPEINNIDPLWPGAGAAQLMPGFSEERLRMSFVAITEAFGQDLYAAEFQVELSLDGSSLIFRRLGSVERLPISSPQLDGICIEYNRADGRRNIIQAPGFDEITGEPTAQLAMNGEDRFPFDCPELGDYAYDIDASQNPNELVVLSRMPGRANTDAWRVDINEPNYCVAIQDDIAAADAAGQTPFEAGLLVERESTGARETRIAIDETFEAITREVGSSAPTYFYWINPATGERRHLERNPDGTWTEEDPQTITGTSDNTTGDLTDSFASSVIKRTIGGRVFHLYVFEATVDVVLQVLALEETPVGSGILTEVPVEMAGDDAEVDDDADGRSNLDEGNAGCRWRSNPGGVDVSGPEGIDVSDGTEDACQANCEAGGWPGVDPAAETNASGLRVCASELGYANAFTDEDGSTFHSNADLVLAADGAIAVQPGQTIRYIHSKDPRVSEAPSRDIRFPDGNSVHVRINNTQHLNGDPGTAPLSYHSYEGYDPLAPPVTVTFDSPTEGWMDYPPAIGAELGLEGSDVEVRAGEENLLVPCPPNCPPDSGTPDAGVSDASRLDAGTQSDAAIPDASNPDASTRDATTPDASVSDAETHDATQPDAETPDAPQPDAETPDAETPDAATQTPEAGPSDDSRKDSGPEPQPDSDSGMRADAGPGRVDTGDDNGNPPPGCSCEVPGKNQNSDPFNAAPIILAAAGLAGLSRQRRKRS